MNSFVTIYGEICKRKIVSDNQTYWLIYNSFVKVPKKGWFLLRKVGKGWKIQRQLLEDKAKVLIDRTDVES